MDLRFEGEWRLLGGKCRFCIRCFVVVVGRGVRVFLERNFWKRGRVFVEVEFRRRIREGLII